MRLFRNTLPHFKGTYLRLSALLIFIAFLNVLITATNVLTVSNVLLGYVVLLISLFVQAAFFVGVYRICFENRSFASSIEVDRTIFVVMEAYGWIYMLNTLNQLLFGRIFILYMAIKIVILIFTVLLPALALRGYRGYQAFKQSNEMLKSDLKQLWGLLLLQIVIGVLSIYIIPYKGMIVSTVYLTRIYGISIFIDTSFWLGFINLYVVPVILSAILVVFTIVATIKYTEYV